MYYIMDDHGRKIRFRMNRVQYTLYQALWWLNIVLKSRQHGITTLVCLFFLDACLFGTNVRAGIVAHKLEDAKKIFRDKVKYAYLCLPEELKQRIVTIKDDAMELVFSNNSSFYVGTSMRSGTLQYLHISEYSYTCQHAPIKAKEIKAGAVETVHEGGYVIIESTAEGVGDDFQNMCVKSENLKKAVDKGEVKLTRMDYLFHFFPWYLKPENVLHEEVRITDVLADYFARIERETGDKIDGPHRNWYVKKKDALGDMMYKEHPSTAEEAFYASVEGAYYQQYMIAAHEQNRIREVAIEDSAPVWCFWDLGDMHTAIWFVQFVEDWINCIDYYYDNKGLGPHEYAKLIDTKRYIYGKEHFVGPDVATSNAKKAGETILDLYARVGINFRPIDPHLRIERINASKSILNKTRFDKIRCKGGIEALSNYRKEKNETASTEDIAVYKDSPVHDWASHGADAFGHLALAYFTQSMSGTILGRRSNERVQNYEQEQTADYEPLGVS